MWHKKILTSINISHYLNDVFKLEGDQLEHTAQLINQHAGSVYEQYCRQYPENKGTLARALKKVGVIPNDYIEPPLTYAIDEIAWAITHGYVHPREVIAIKYKDAVNLLKAISNDVLKTLLSNSDIENDPKLVHYLETELNIREATNIEEFEDFNVKPANNEAFMALKLSSGLETKAAKLLFTPKPVQEEEGVTSNDLIGISRRSSSIGTRVTFTEYQSNRDPFRGNDVINEGNNMGTAVINTLSSVDFFEGASRTRDMVIQRYCRSVRMSSSLTWSIIFRLGDRVAQVRLTAAIAAHLVSHYIQDTNASFAIVPYSSTEAVRAAATRGDFNHLVDLRSVSNATNMFGAIVALGEHLPASGVEEDSDNE